MKHLSLFPSVIGWKVDEEIASSTLPYAESALNDPKNLSNYWGYPTTYHKDLSDDLIPEKTRNFLHTSVLEYSESLGITDFKIKKLAYFYSNINYDHLHAVHDHQSCAFAGILYLSVTSNCSKLKFLHQSFDRHDYSNYNIDSSSPLVWNSFDITPSNGLLLIWPAWVLHQVLPSYNRDDRFTLVFNVDGVKGPN